MDGHATATVAPLHGEDGVLVRLRRHAVGIAVLGGGAAVLGRVGVFPDSVPWWLPATAFLVVSVAIAGTYAAMPGVTPREVQVRAAVHAVALTAVTYATGWGFVLAFVHLFGIADSIDEAGSRATRAALGWAVAATAIAQLALQVGLAPMAPVATRVAHLVATVTVVLLVLVTRRLRGAAVERERARVELANSEARFRTLVEDANDVLLLLGSDLGVRYASPSILRVLGHHDADVLAQGYLELVHPDERERLRSILQDTVEGRDDDRVVAHRARHGDGRWVTVEVGRRNLLADPVVEGLVLSLRDVGERLRLEAELAHGRLHDDATGLPNRLQFDEWLDELQVGDEQAAGIVTLTLRGLDRMAQVGGPDAVRATVEQLAVELGGLVEAPDRLARTGDARFDVVVGEGDADELHRRAAWLQARVGRDVTVGDGQVRLAAATGIVSLGGLDDVGDLGRAVEMVSHLSVRGGQTIAVFDEAMQAALVERLVLENELGTALGRDELVLHYQPLVAVEPEGVAARLVGVEALVRWQHPRRGLLQPATFVPLAEETGQVLPLGWLVLDQALAQLSVWDLELGEGTVGYVSVNVSMHQVGTGQLVERVSRALAVHDVAPSRLVLELTETALTDAPDLVAEQLRALHRLGVVLAVDDFGTGYSSMSYLQRFPFDILKIDRAFVDSTRTDHSPELLRSMVDMGRTLGLRTVAEGIETEGELATVRGFGCDVAQGYLLGRPVPPGELPLHLLRGGSRVAAR